jgi:hypothetical protein
LLKNNSLATDSQVFQKIKIICESVANKILKASLLTTLLKTNPNTTMFGFFYRYFCRAIPI